MRRRSLRAQLLLWLLGPLSVLLSVSALFVYSGTVELATMAYDRALFDSALALANQISAEGNRVIVDLPPEARTILRYDEHDKIYFQVRDQNGRVISGDSVFPTPPAELSATLPGHAMFYDGTIDENPVRIAALILRLDHTQPARSLLVQVAETVVKRDTLTRQAMSVIATIYTVILVIAALVVIVGVTRGLAPLSALGRAIGQRSHNDLRPVAADAAPQEAVSLVYALNDLLDRLSASVHAQRQFIENAAHQLRTPLAGIQTQAEYALRQKPPADIAQNLSQLFQAARRASHLANQLLALARAEPGAISEECFQPTDLTRLCKSTAAEWVPFALSREMDLGYEGPEGPVMIHAEPTLVKSILDNLLDNAIRHNPPGTQITVALEKDPHPALRVDDSGVGIPQPERAAVFERFHRGRTHDREGSGLGLSIVAEAARVLGAEVRLGSAPGGRGTRLTVRFLRG